MIHLLRMTILCPNSDLYKPSPTKKNEGYLDNWIISGLRQEMYNILFSYKITREGSSNNETFDQDIIDEGENKLGFWERTLLPEETASAKSVGGIVFAVLRKSKEVFLAAALKVRASVPGNGSMA